MGFKDFMGKRAAEYKEAEADFRRGCEILGPPSDWRSIAERNARIQAGRRERQEQGRWIEYGYGEMDGKSVYYEKRGNKVDIFPDGMPTAHHSRSPHDHYVINADQMTFMRVDGRRLVGEEG